MLLLPSLSPIFLLDFERKENHVWQKTMGVAVLLKTQFLCDFIVHFKEYVTEQRPIS